MVVHPSQAVAFDRSCSVCGQPELGRTLKKKRAITPRDSSKHFPDIKVFRNGGLWQARSGEPTCVIGVAYALADGNGRLARDVVFSLLEFTAISPRKSSPIPNPGFDFRQATAEMLA